MAIIKQDYGEIGVGGYSGGTIMMTSTTATATASSQSNTNYAPSNVLATTGAWYPNKTGFPTGEWIKITFNNNVKKKVTNIDVWTAVNAGTFTDGVWEISDDNENVIGEMVLGTTERMMTGYTFNVPVETSFIQLKAKSVSSSSGLTYQGFQRVEVMYTDE